MPSVPDRVRNALFLPENPRSVAAWARRRRWQLLAQTFPGLGSMRVLDLGGTPWSWSSSPIHPAELTVLNLTSFDDTHGARCIVGDVCDPPAALADLEFDLLYSNSVIEHVGGHERRRAFADLVSQRAGHHWIQTPARSFPIEPHWLFPGFQFLPVPLRAGISRHWPLGHVRSAPGDDAGAVEDVLAVELVSAAEMRALFPASAIKRERLVGLTKSYIAVR